jgi:KDO2-lipid IV(A) lauroyltransferase
VFGPEARPVGAVEKRMKASRRIRYVLEYVALRLAFVFFGLIPVPLAVCIARRMAALMFLFARSRRQTAIENILRAGIASDRPAARRIARASFLHFGAMGAETLKAGGFFRRHEISEYLRLVMSSDETRYIMGDPEQGVILVTAHLGNWELAATRMGMVKPVLSVARKMNNPYVNRFLAEGTHRAHMRIVPKRGGRRSPLVAALKGGESIAILMDQHARKKAMVVDFFGVPAASETSPARLHLATGAPVIPGVCIREGKMRYTIKLGAPIRHQRTSDRDADVHAILVAINQAIEQFIRQHPDQYLWSHRRWRIKSHAAGNER